MAFQPSGFEPTQKTRKRGRRRKRRPLGHLKAAPYLAPMEQNAWQRGYTDVPGWTRRKPVLFQIATTVAGCGFGLTLGSTWWERALLAAALAVVAFLGGLVALWLWHSLTAPVRQRNEARDYALALEAHMREYAKWARRREIAEDFLRDTFAHREVVLAGNDPRTPEELETHWRTTVNHIAAMMEAEGASDNELHEIRGGLAGLDARDDGYGENHTRRIWNNMGVISQNLRTVNRAQPPPNPPSPPTLRD